MAMGTLPPAPRRAKTLRIRPWRSAAAAAVFLAASGTASAQSNSTIYVDTGGNDVFDGTASANQGGGVGPVRTLTRALQLAAANSGISTISVEVGDYYTEPGPLNLTRGLTFVSTPDPLSSAFTTVNLNQPINVAASGVTFRGTAGTRFYQTQQANGLTLTSGSLTSEAGALRLANDIDIARISGSASGSFTFDGAVDVVYTGPASVTSGAELPSTLGANGSLTVAFSAASQTLTLADGALTAASGSSITVNAGHTIAGTINVTGTVDFTGPGNTGSVNVLSGGMATLQSNLTAENVVVATGGGLVFGTNTLTVRADFRRTGGMVSGDTGTLAFVGGAAAATFEAGPNFRVQNLTIGSAQQAKDLTFTQDVTVGAGGAGTFSLVSGNVFLGTRTITFDSPGTFTANGTIRTDATSTLGGVVFTQAGATLDGTGTISNIDVVDGAGQITAAGNTGFTGILSLTRGGINVTGDLSPMGTGAQVIVNAENDGTWITGAFNGDEVGYDLTYRTTSAAGSVFGGTRMAMAEWDTERIRNLRIDARGTINASARPGGTIDGTVMVMSDVTATTTTVEMLTVLFPGSPVTIAGAAGIGQGSMVTTTSTIQLNTSSTVAGGVAGSGTLLLADGVTVSGGAGASASSPDASMLTNVRVLTGATATIQGIKVIAGDLTTDATSTLNLGLVADAGPSATDRSGGNVNGVVMLGGTRLALTSNVEFTNAMVSVNTGTLALGTNSLTLSNPAVVFTMAAASADSIEASTGRLVFASTGTLVANDQTVPNLDIFDDVMLTSKVRVSTQYRQRAAGAELTGVGNAMLMGAASFVGGNGASGTGSMQLSSLAMSFAGSTTFMRGTQLNGGDITLSGPGEWILADTLTANAGALNQGSVTVALTAAGLAFDYNGGALNSTGGLFEFRGGAAQTYDLAAATSIDYLSINNAAGVAFAGTPKALTVDAGFLLKAGTFDFETNPPAPATPVGDLVFANDVMITRWAGSLAPGDLPTYGTGLRYVYGDAGGAFAGMTTTGNELQTGGTIASLTIYDGVTLNRRTTTSEFILAGMLNATLTDSDANGDDYVTVAANGYYRLEGVANVVEGPGLETNFLGFYTLEYRNYVNGVASSRELPASNLVPKLIVNQAGASGSPTVLQFPLNFGPRTFDMVDVVAGQLDLNGNTINIEGNANFATSAATLISSTAGANLRFTGAKNGTLRVGAPGYVVPTNIDVTIEKTDKKYFVDLVGGFLDFETNSELLYLRRGILRAGTQEQRNQVYVYLDHKTQSQQNINSVDRGQGYVLYESDGTAMGLRPGTTFPQGYIAGNVRKQFSNDPSGTLADPQRGFRAGRVEFPTGDTLGNFNPFTMDFESNAAAASQTFAERRVTVTYVRQRPVGTNGFPIANGVSQGSNVTNLADFYWFVTSDPTLGASTLFNAEARNEEYDLQADENVQSLRLVRREVSGNAEQNPYTLVGLAGNYANYLLDPTPQNTTNADEVPVVVARDAQTLLSPAGTIFTYGTQRGSAVTVPQTIARIQFSHFAPDAPSPVDVYVNGALAVDNLAYGMASAYVNVTGANPVTIMITGPSDMTAVRTLSLPVTQGQNYFAAVVPNGADATNDAVDVVVRQTGLTARQGDKVDLYAVHGVTGGPAVDVRLETRLVPVPPTVIPGFSNLAYGATAGPASIDPVEYDFEIVPAGTSTPLISSTFDLSGMRGETGVLVVAGNQTPSPTAPTRSLNVFYVRSNGTVVTGRITTDVETAELPTEFAVMSVAPNPVRDRTDLRLNLPATAEVSVRVYDLLGREVMTLSPMMVEAGANQRLQIDASSLSSGVYVYRLTARVGVATQHATGQMTVAR